MNDTTLQAPTNLVALRDGRQRAEALISARFTEGLIDQDEFERRLEAVHDARTLAELERLIVDIVEPGTSPSAALVVRTPAPSTALARPEAIAEQRKLVAVFGSLEQRGRWIPARHNRVVDVFGEAEIDLREAVLGPGETVFEVRCVFASAQFLVPPGLAVRVETGVVLGGIERDPEIPNDPLSPDDPVVVIRGRVVFATLELAERASGERKRDARRRHRAERKARRKALKSGER